MKGYVPTPPRVVDLMVCKLFLRRKPKESELLLDPGCGEGAFIEGVLRHCEAHGLAAPRMIGVELDARRASQARTRFAGVPNVQILQQDYLEDALGPADYIIGNPPYVPITSLQADEKARYREAFNCAAGRFDLYLLFYERSVANLKPGGRLCFVTPEKFEYVATAAPLRRLLSSYEVRELHHLPEDTFPGLVTYPTIVSVTKRIRRADSATRVLLRDGQSREIRLPQDGGSWNGSINESPSHNGGLTLRDVTTRISCGVATGADDIYVMGAAQLPPGLRRFAHPTISGRQLSSAREEPEPRDVMLLPYDAKGRLLPESALGDLRTFLARPDNLRALKARTCHTTGKKPWYAFHDTVPLKDLRRPKLLCKDVASEPRFWTDRSGRIVPRHSVYYVVPSPEADFERLGRYLNGPEAQAWLRANCQRAANGYVRLQSSTLKDLPVPQDVLRKRPAKVRPLPLLSP